MTGGNDRHTRTGESGVGRGGPSGPGDRRVPPYDPAAVERVAALLGPDAGDGRSSRAIDEARVHLECEAVAAIADPTDSSRTLVEKLARRGVHLHERAVRRRISRMRTDLGEVAHPGSDYVGRERGRRLHEDRSGRVACRWRERHLRRTLP